MTYAGQSCSAVIVEAKTCAGDGVILSTFLMVGGLMEDDLALLGGLGLVAMAEVVVRVVPVGAAFVVVVAPASMVVTAAEAAPTDLAVAEATAAEREDWVRFMFADVIVVKDVLYGSIVVCSGVGWREVFSVVKSPRVVSATRVKIRSQKVDGQFE